MNTLKNVTNFAHTITFKLMLVGFISLILLIPAAWIRIIINERHVRGNEVRSEISSIWGRDQTIAGPVLSVPIKRYYQDEGKNMP